MGMGRHKRLAVAGVAVVAIAAVGAGAAIASGGDDSESPIVGSELARASAAALASTGGGRVTQTEVGDEDSYYEVEVTLEDGSQVDVQLDRDFKVVASEVDDDSTEDDGSTDD